MNVTIAGAEAFDTEAHSIDGDTLTEFASLILRTEGLEAETSVAIGFIGVGDIAELNERHMGKAGPTDLLSFPIEDAVPGTPPKRTKNGPPLDLGDIFISTNVVKQHADEYGVEFSDELHLMVCHGLLHLLGWDHETDQEAELMERREAELLGLVGRVRR
jgi:probable rRNA maturation factor